MLPDAASVRSEEQHAEEVTGEVLLAGVQGGPADDIGIRRCSQQCQGPETDISPPAEGSEPRSSPGLTWRLPPVFLFFFSYVTV